MSKYGLLGYPLGHTMSPPIHKRLFELDGKADAEYGVCEFAPEILADKIEYLNSLGGYNITIPYKVEIIKHIDGLDESAKRYNSVNCVAKKDGKYIGYNTDCDGFLRSLEAAGAKLSGDVLQCVPMQTDLSMFEEMKALECGTLFCVLNKPFAGKCCR